MQKDREIFLLAVGCGEGFFLKSIYNQNMNTMGIDISESAVAYAKNVLGQEVLESTIEDVVTSNEQYRGKFDIVTLWATIEYVPNPLTLLQSINKCLKDDGILFFDTGIDSYKIRKFLVGHTQWYSPIEHLFVFSKMGLEILLKSANFEILRFYKNYERTICAKIKKWLQISYLSLISFLFFRHVLTTRQYISMKTETRCPICYRALTIARKK